MDFYRATRGLIKKVDIYFDPDDPESRAHIEFFGKLDLVLRTYDLKNKPLNAAQIRRLICHYDLVHFLNPNHKSYKKHKLDSNTIDRNEVVGLLEQDNLLFRLPIIVIGRLMTVGFNEKRIAEMLLDTPRDLRPDEEVVRVTSPEVQK